MLKLVLLGRHAAQIQKRLQTDPRAANILFLGPNFAEGVDVLVVGDLLKFGTNHRKGNLWVTDSAPDTVLDLVSDLVLTKAAEAI